MQKFIFVLLAIPVLVWGQDSLNVRKLAELSYYWDQPSGMAVSDTLAFIASGMTGLRILNVSDPSKPDEIGYFENGNNANDVALTGNLACLVEPRTLRLIDVSNPTAPHEVGLLSYDLGNIVDVKIVGSFAYLASWFPRLEDCGYFKSSFPGGGPLCWAGGNN
ncbi:MAG: hypothetical protein IPP40_13315 [bacterium]|nr:hypothetical protein [bacterium]